MEAPTSLSKSDDQSRQRDGTTWLPLDDSLLRFGVGLSRQSGSSRKIRRIRAELLIAYCALMDSECCVYARISTEDPRKMNVERVGAGAGPSGLRWLKEEERRDGAVLVGFPAEREREQGCRLKEKKFRGNH
ncbi:hypothetical protein NL676_029777 [Syzygium grande]|nr:hypothetical protein NL676_029777 [Syzygium grande]